MQVGTVFLLPLNKNVNNPKEKNTYIIIKNNFQMSQSLLLHKLVQKCCKHYNPSMVLMYTYFVLSRKNEILDLYFELLFRTTYLTDNDANDILKIIFVLLSCGRI